MTPKQLNILMMALIVLAAGTVQVKAGPSQSAPSRDPVRWTTEDVTAQARYTTARKEAGAALQEATAECGRIYGPDRAGCLKDARERFDQDLAAAKQLLVR